MKRLRLTFLLLALAACGGDRAGGNGGNDPNPDPPEGYSMTGSWFGAVGTPEDGFAILATITDNDGAISGSGTLLGGAADCPQATSGVRTGYNYSITFTCDGFLPIRFTGTMPSDSVMDGLLNGSGFDQLPFLMFKDPAGAVAPR